MQQFPFLTLASYFSSLHAHSALFVTLSSTFFPLQLNVCISEAIRWLVISLCSTAPIYCLCTVLDCHFLCSLGHRCCYHRPPLIHTFQAVLRCCKIKLLPSLSTLSPFSLTFICPFLFKHCFSLCFNLFCRVAFE